MPRDQLMTLLKISAVITSSLAAIFWGCVVLVIFTWPDAPAPVEPADDAGFYHVIHPGDCAEFYDTKVCALESSTNRTPRLYRVGVAQMEQDAAVPDVYRKAEPACVCPDVGAY